MQRRTFFKSGLAATAIAAGLTQEGQASPGKSIKILGIACSPRQGKSTATSVGVALEAARQTNSSIQTELIDLGALSFSGWNGSGKFAEDDFSGQVLPKLKDPALGGMII
jgi:hypothetical protein